MKSLRIIYFSTLINPLVVIGIYSLSIDKGTIMMNNSIGEVFKYLVPILGLILIPIGFVLFRKRQKSIEKMDDINAKLQQYRGIFVQRIAFIEGIAILATVSFLITLDNLFLAYTLISLAFFIPIYPTDNRMNADLNIELDSIDSPTTEQKNTNFFSKNPWLIVPFILLMILLNYNSLKEFFANKVVLPDVKIDNGTVIDSIYHNDYLGWTFIIPSDFNITPISEIESSEKKGNEILGNKPNKNEKPIRLLNISNRFIDFRSGLNPRALFPNLTSEERYLEDVENRLKSVDNNKFRIEKKNQGIVFIDSLEFKFLELLLIGEKKNIGMVFMSRFNKDYILDLSFSYQDSLQAVRFLDRLKKSDFNWK